MNERVWWILGLVSVLGLGNPARAVEMCQYADMASHRGRAAVQTEVTQAGGLLTVNVLARLDASPWRLWDVQFLAQEVSTWRNGELQSVAVNGRYSVNGRAKRQQWDVFARTPDGLQATRVQAKTLRDFQRRHPAFTAHWDPAQFGRSWLADYPAAQPERRTDLDLPRAAMPAGMRTPFALAFYWSRWLPSAGGMVPVFLPGWKRDARVDAPVMPVAPGRWRMALRHPALDGAPSWTEATVSADHRLLRLTFDVHAPAGDGQGWVDGTGCQGTPVP